MVYAHGISLKKRYGQHFLRDQRFIDAIISRVELDATSSVFEIGCGDGFLTRAIVQQPLARLWVFEIDAEWVAHVRSTVDDARMTVFEENILDIEVDRFADHAPWTLLANLPYQITFPILYKLYDARHYLKEGVIMVQEEVAQKIVKTGGRGYGYPSLFLQHYFDWELLDKVPPSAFYPPPKVFSRLLYFKPKKEVKPIPNEQQFWRFIKACFLQPRRTLRNNLVQTNVDLQLFNEELLSCRAQQLAMDDFLHLWEQIGS